jgi:hypothetical protein
LWRELHRHDPVQFQLAFRDAPLKAPAVELVKREPSAMPLFVARGGSVSDVANELLF